MDITAVLLIGVIAWLLLSRSPQGTVPPARALEDGIPVTPVRDPGAPSGYSTVPGSSEQPRPVVTAYPTGSSRPPRFGDAPVSLAPQTRPPETLGGWQGSPVPSYNPNMSNGTVRVTRSDGTVADIRTAAPTSADGRPGIHATPLPPDAFAATDKVPRTVTIRLPIIGNRTIPINSATATSRPVRSGRPL